MGGRRDGHLNGSMSLFTPCAGHNNPHPSAVDAPALAVAADLATSAPSLPQPRAKRRCLLRPPAVPRNTAAVGALRRGLPIGRGRARRGRVARGRSRTPVVSAAARCGSPWLP